MHELLERYIDDARREATDFLRALDRIEADLRDGNDKDASMRIAHQARNTNVISPLVDLVHWLPTCRDEEAQA